MPTVHESQSNTSASPEIPTVGNIRCSGKFTAGLLSVPLRSTWERKMKMDYEDMMKKARATNKQRDNHERKVGFMAASDCSLDLQIRTAMSAIQAGIASNDWVCIAEAQAMLEQVEKLLRNMGANNGNHTT